MNLKYVAVAAAAAALTLEVYSADGGVCVLCVYVERFVCTCVFMCLLVFGKSLVYVCVDMRYSHIHIPSVTQIHRIR